MKVDWKQINFENANLIFDTNRNSIKNIKKLIVNVNNHIYS